MKVEIIFNNHTMVTYDNVQSFLQASDRTLQISWGEDKDIEEIKGDRWKSMAVWQ